MKRNISIFIAGATKETRNERECLKILANDLSSAKRAQGISINAMSYKNFDDNQERYNEFIVNEADLVFIILKGGIGDKTKEEFLKAAEAWREKKRPEIIVFLDESTLDEKSSSAGEIRGLIEASLNQQYPVRYSTLEELRSAARTRIERYLEKNSADNQPALASSKKSASVKNLQSPNPIQHEITSKSPKFFRFWQAWLLAALALIAGGLLLWHAVFRAPEPLLVFAGGGSVAQFLKENQKVDVENFDNSIYCRMPSSQSWRMLAEEVNRTIDNENISKNKFYPISISAYKAVDSSFLKASTKEVFKNHAAIISYYLGEDTLMLYLTNNICKKYDVEKSELNASQFKELIQKLHKDNVRILHTTPTSGTLRCWQQYMTPDDSIFFENDFSAIYNATSSTKHLGLGSEYAILGSRYYFIKSLKSDNKAKNSIKEIKIRDTKGIVSKPMYLYFVAYQIKSQTPDIYWIPNEVMQFLEKLNIHDTIWNNTAIWDTKNGLINGGGESLIIPLNERPN